MNKALSIGLGWDVLNGPMSKAKNAYCSGGFIKDTYYIRKVGWNNVDILHAVLVPSSNGYNLWFE